MKTTILALVVVLLAGMPAMAQDRPAPDPRSMGGGDCDANVYNCVDTPNPLPAPDTVWLEDASSGSFR